MSRLETCLQQLASKIEDWKKEGFNETQTRTTLINPVLSALGWSIDDPMHVRHSFKVSDGTFADYVFFANDKLLFIIEAKALNEHLSIKSTNQLFGYCGKLGASFGVITNGNEWKVYRTLGSPDLKNRLLISVRIDYITENSSSLSETASCLEQISKSIVSTGNLPIKMAVSDNRRESDFDSTAENTDICRENTGKDSTKLPLFLTSA